MTLIELMTIVSFLAFLLCGALTGSRHSHHPWVGAATGIVTWMASCAGCLSILTIRDFAQRERYPLRKGPGPIAIATLLLSFGLFGVVSVVLIRWIVAHPITRFQ
jgi:hypothetical protein